MPNGRRTLVGFSLTSYVERQPPMGQLFHLPLKPTSRRTMVEFFSKLPRLRLLLPFPSNLPGSPLLDDLGDSMTTIGRLREDAHVPVKMPKIKDKSPIKKSLLNRKLGGLLFVL